MFKENRLSGRESMHLRGVFKSNLRRESIARFYQPDSTGILVENTVWDGKTSLKVN